MQLTRFSSAGKAASCITGELDSMDSTHVRGQRRATDIVRRARWAVFALASTCVLYGGASAAAAQTSASVGPSTPSAPARLVGDWRLIVFVDSSRRHGAVRTFGENPVGIFSYSAAGRMSVQVMQTPTVDLPTLDSAHSGAGPSPAEYHRAIHGFLAYMGTYTVNAAADTITVRVDAESPRDQGFQHYVGTTQHRPFSLHGDTLRIEMIGPRPDGDHVDTLRQTRVLVRVKT
jgi:hypothetical protein